MSASSQTPDAAQQRVLASSRKHLESDPLWFKDAIIYELHVKAFADGSGDGVGDFIGLIDKLDYLQDLGVTCLWLLPFYPSPLKDDGYDIADYLGVHEKYGKPTDFRSFVREAHKRGMRIITELVINHTSDQHAWFQAARQAPPGSSKRNFYVWSDTDQKYREARIIFIDSEASNWTWDEQAQAYYWHRFFHHQPDLNFDNPRVLSAVLRVMRYWLDIGVDGLRLDAIPYLIEREDTNCENLPETHAVLKKFRAELDANYQDRIFLAEANQWPADVRPYFGDGDECHMAFHFPLMPRMFMALRQEDRHPIVEIMRQTPPIPGNCQWAVFLRNHDELTLEMVTDEERDYMYREYAADPKARINLGIRRRLAPLLDNSRPRIELLMSMLFSFPGTPVIYYGDEIGMGDNVFLGDRDGVRTPMQWTSDRNAGFSRADFAKLYLPPIMDPVYGFQAINVEAQQRSPASLLNWTKRLIALRKRFKAFGRGSFEFLRSPNRKVLTYLRRHDNEIILCVANLSRYVQPVELDLSEFEGMTPVELFGRVHFPRIGELPYFLTLGPHAFYWFQLELDPKSAGAQPPQLSSAETSELPLLNLGGKWTTLMEGPSRANIERTVLPKFLKRQRWFGSKARTIETVTIRDWTMLTTEPCCAFATLVEIYYSVGESEHYVVPLGITTGQRAEEWLHRGEPLLAARVRGPQGEGVLHDALADDGVCRRLLELVEGEQLRRTHAGTLDASRTSAFGGLRGAEPLEGVPIERVPAETSNSMLIFNNKLLLKIFRKLEPGINPDLEIGRFMTDVARFDRVPKTAGAIEYQPSGGQPCTVALLQERVYNQGSGWHVALEEIDRYYERANSRAHASDSPSLALRSPLELEGAQPSQELSEVLGMAPQAAAMLGKRTAQMHLALAGGGDQPDFTPEPWTAADRTALAQRIRREGGEALELLSDHMHELPEDYRDLAHRLLEDGPRFTENIDKPAAAAHGGAKIRCHGDYHLGQVLWVENDWVIIDFEGEPKRSLAERREKQSPLRDLAGMLRSLDYVAYAGLFHATEDRPDDFDLLEPWGHLWSQWTSAALLRAYRKETEGADFLPTDPAQFADLLKLFILEKALYELQYELNNRPNWTRIPLMGILQLMERK